jgi:hypothetical protein
MLTLNPPEPFKLSDGETNCVLFAQEMVIIELYPEGNPDPVRITAELLAPYSGLHDSAGVGGTGVWAKTGTEGVKKTARVNKIRTGKNHLLFMLASLNVLSLPDHRTTL